MNSTIKRKWLGGSCDWYATRHLESLQINTFTKDAITLMQNMWTDRKKYILVSTPRYSSIHWNEAVDDATRRAVLPNRLMRSHTLECYKLSKSSKKNTRETIETFKHSIILNKSDFNDAVTCNPIWAEEFVIEMKLRYNTVCMLQIATL